MLFGFCLFCFVLKSVCNDAGCECRAREGTALRHLLLSWSYLVHLILPRDRHHPAAHRPGWTFNTSFQFPKAFWFLKMHTELPQGLSLLDTQISVTLMDLNCLSGFFEIPHGRPCAMPLKALWNVICVDKGFFWFVFLHVRKGFLEVYFSVWQVLCSSIVEHT